MIINFNNTRFSLIHIKLDWGAIDLDFIRFKNIFAFEFISGVRVVEWSKGYFAVQGVKFVDLGKNSNQSCFIEGSQMWTTWHWISIWNGKFFLSIFLSIFHGQSPGAESKVPDWKKNENAIVLFFGVDALYWVWGMHDARWRRLRLG